MRARSTATKLNLQDRLVSRFLRSLRRARITLRVSSISPRFLRLVDMVVMVNLASSLGNNQGDSQGRAQARAMVEVPPTLARKVQERAQVPATVEVVRHPAQMAGLTRALNPAPMAMARIPNRETILERRRRTKAKMATNSLTPKTILELRRRTKGKIAMASLIPVASRIHLTTLKDRKDGKDRKARQAAALDLAKKVARLQAAHQAATAAQEPEAMENLLAPMVTARAKAMAILPTATTILTHRTKAKALA